MEPAGIGLSLVQRKKVQFDDGVGSGVRCGAASGGWNSPADWLECQQRLLSGCQLDSIIRRYAVGGRETEAGIMNRFLCGNVE